MGGVCGDGGGSVLIPVPFTSSYSALRLVINVNLTQRELNKFSVTGPSPSGAIIFFQN
jgi:hypothetical protein